MLRFLIVLVVISSCMGCSTSTETVKLESMILGEKSPVIILENGMASTFDTWKEIPIALSEEATVLQYNRAGLGTSEIAKTKRTIPNMVTDLDTLLEEKNLEGPFILVAHSMGSYLSRYFALLHPEKVAGILLIDPSPDTMYDGYTEKETQDFLSFGNDNFKGSNASVKAEWENYLDNRKFVQKPISDAISMTILSATQWDFYQYHVSILNKHPQTKHIKIEGSHDLHHDHPTLIVEEVQKLIELSKNKN